MPCSGRGRAKNTRDKSTGGFPQSRNVADTPSTGLRGPFDRLRGPFDRLRGPFDRLRGPFDKLRGPSAGSPIPLQQAQRSSGRAQGPSTGSGVLSEAAPG